MSQSSNQSFTSISLVAPNAMVPCHRLRAIIASVESDYFRSTTDVGSNGCAMTVWNALRRHFGLTPITADDLPTYDPTEEKYVRPVRSALIAPSGPTDGLKQISQPAEPPAPSTPGLPASELELRKENELLKRRLKTAIGAVIRYRVPAQTDEKLRDSIKTLQDACDKAGQEVAKLTQSETMHAREYTTKCSEVAALTFERDNLRRSVGVMAKQLENEKQRRAKAMTMLSSVLCDHAGVVCAPGSGGDQVVVGHALNQLKEPLTEKEDDPMYGETRVPLDKLTCFGCPARVECPFVDDQYNTNGDCLLSK